MPDRDLLPVPAPKRRGLGLCLFLGLALLLAALPAAASRGAKGATTRASAGAAAPVFDLDPRYRGEETPAGVVADGMTFHTHYNLPAEQQQARLTWDPKRQAWLGADGKRHDSRAAVRAARGRQTNKGDIRAKEAFDGFDAELWVLGTDGALYVTAEQHSGQVHHSTLLAGGSVRGAGMIVFRQGKLSYLNNQSGHYKPTDAALQALAQGSELHLAPHAQVFYCQVGLASGDCVPEPCCKGGKAVDDAEKRRLTAVRQAFDKNKKDAWSKLIKPYQAQRRAWDAARSEACAEHEDEWEEQALDAHPWDDPFPERDDPEWDAWVKVSTGRFDFAEDQRVAFERSYDQANPKPVKPRHRDYDWDGAQWVARHP